MPGSIAENFHEGTRSELYAGLVLSTIGTASPVPHQEDTGVDYYCTLTEREGQRGLVTDLFTVQVKSNLEPWVFSTPESVRWLVAHPLPLFLCVVNRAEGSVAIYHTSPRFYLWAMPPLPDCVNLQPTQDEIGQCTQWEGGTTFSLSAPILTLSVRDVEQQSFRDMAKEVLKFWISVDKANLARMVDGIHSFQMPHEYRINSTKYGATVAQSLRQVSQEDLVKALSRLLEQLSWNSQQLFRQGDRGGSLRAIMLLRHLSGSDFAYDPFILKVLNEDMGNSKYVYAGLDELNKVLDSAASAFIGSNS